jgi:predicted phage terminase large subunit-like protein
MTKSDASLLASRRRALLIEYGSREAARASLAGFANAIDVPGRPLTDENEAGDWLFKPIETTQAAHHYLLMRHLERLVDPADPMRQMMVFMPPGAAKSTYGSVVMPSYAMGKHQGTRVIMASYASPIAQKQSRKVRAIVRQPKYGAIFKTGIAAGNESVESWALDNGSEYMAGGILSGMTGNRANGLIVDDPVKGREDADSETIRRKTREAYEDDLTTRLLPGGWTLIIQTRWHQDDLSGGILPKDWSGQSGMIRGRDGLDWFVLCLPAECDRSDDPLGRKIGEPLWPQWFAAGHFDRFRRNPRTWSALFQQKPVPETGDYFKAEWFRYYDKRPTALRIYGATDAAVTDDQDSDGEPDYTEHGIIGVDAEGNAFVLDWWFGQTTADVWVDAQLDLCKRWKPLKWFGEAGVIRRATEPFLKKRMRERKVFQVLDWLPSITDKPTRARSIQGRFSMGMVYLPGGDNAPPWVARLVAQMLGFPAASFDDGVDVLSLFGRGLDTLQNAQEEKVVEKKSPQPGSMEWLLARTQQEKERSKYRG